MVLRDSSLQQISQNLRAGKAFHLLGTLMLQLGPLRPKWGHCVNPRQVRDGFLYFRRAVKQKPRGTGSTGREVTREDAMGSSTLQHHLQSSLRVPSVDLPLNHCLEWTMHIKQTHRGQHERSALILANRCQFLPQKPFPRHPTGSQWTNENGILASSDLLLLQVKMGLR